MADELHTPNHRWYEPRNHIALAKEDLSKQFIFNSGIQKIDAWINSQPWGNPIPSLFANGEVGVWYDPSPETTFTDTAGTTPATVGSAVARINDLSGNGHHATQATTAARPILARVPARGRVNLLTRTEEFDNAVWKENGTLPRADQFVTANADFDPAGGLTADRLTFSPTATNTWWGQSGITFQSGVTYTFSVWLKRVSGSGSIRINTNPYGSGGGWVTVAVTSEWQRFSVTQTATATTSPAAAAGILAVEAGQVIDAWGAQVEAGSTASAYQKVVSTYDVTEAGQADNYFLWFDGIDDSMVTPTITPGIDKVQVFAGVRRLVNQNFPTIVELSVNSSLNNGAFGLFADQNQRRPAFDSRGTIAKRVTGASAPSNPVTVVISGISSISEDVLQVRLNGALDGQNTEDQGTATYRVDPLYIGSRAGTSLYFNGQLYSLITRFGANLDANVITQTEKYVSTKTAGVDLT